MKLFAEVSNLKTNKWLPIQLPATHSTLEDTLLRLDSNETVKAYANIVDEHGRSIISITSQTCNLFELNHLGVLIKDFEDDDRHKFIGAYSLMSEEPMTIPKAINLAMNVQQNGVVDYQPANDAYDLAAFYLENDLIPELAEIRDDAYQWIVDHVSLEKVGDEICQKENGTFISGGYVTMGDLQHLYDGTFQIPAPQNYVFKLKVGFCPDLEDGRLYSLPLPAGEEDIRHMMQSFETGLSDLTCYQFQSLVPMLEPMDFAMTELKTLNQLAKSIAEFKDAGKLNTFKAMVDTLDVISLERVTQICEYVHDFELLDRTRDFFTYGTLQLQKMVAEDLLECFSPSDFGRQYAEKNSVTMTNYGALVPKDGMTLQEKLAQGEQTLSPAMAMSM